MDFFSFPQTRHTPQIQSRLRRSESVTCSRQSWYQGIKVSVLVVTSAFLIAVSRWLNRNKRQTSIPIIPPPRLIHTLHTENPCFRHPKQIITCRSFKTQWYVVSWWFNGVKQVWNVFPVLNGSDVKIYSAFRIILNIWMGEKHWLTFAISEVVLKVPLYFFLLSRFLQQYHIWVFRLKKKYIPF